MTIVKKNQEELDISLGGLLVARDLSDPIAHWPRTGVPAQIMDRSTLKMYLFTGIYLFLGYDSELDFVKLFSAEAGRIIHVSHAWMSCTYFSIVQKSM